MNLPILKTTVLRLLAAIPAILLFPASSAADQAAPPAGRTIRAVSWNIEWYPGKRRFARGEEMQAHARLVQTELRKIDPDVLLAQEMRDWQSFADLSDAVPGLRPAVVSAFASEQTGEYWRQQLAIASKLPVEAAWSEPWAEGDPTPRRGFAAAAIRVPDSMDLILFYSLHLKSNRSNSDEETQLNYRTREESVRQLLRHVEHMETAVFKDRIAGVVVGGDFNTNQDGQFGDEVVKLMTAAGYHHTWDGVPRGERLTWRGSKRFEPTTFDHFFTKGLGKATARMLTVPDATSDHWPVELEITLPSKP